MLFTLLVLLQTAFATPGDSFEDCFLLITEVNVSGQRRDTSAPFKLAVDQDGYRLYTAGAPGVEAYLAHNFGQPIVFPEGQSTFKFANSRFAFQFKISAANGSSVGAGESWPELNRPAFTETDVLTAVTKSNGLIGSTQFRGNGIKSPVEELNLPGSLSVRVSCAPTL